MRTIKKHRSWSLTSEDSYVIGIVKAMHVLFSSSKLIPMCLYVLLHQGLGFPGDSTVKNPHLQCRRWRLDPWSGRSPGRGHGNPVFLSGESHEQRSLGNYSPLGHKELDTTEESEHACTNTRTHWRDQSLSYERDFNSLGGESLPIFQAGGGGAISSRCSFWSFQDSERHIKILKSIQSVHSIICFSLPLISGTLGQVNL